MKNHIPFPQPDLPHIPLPLLILSLIFAFCGIRPAHASAPTKITFIGDSITQGGTSVSGNISNVFAYASYRYSLYLNLKDTDYDIDFTGSNSGVYQAEYGRKVSTTAPNPGNNQKGPYYSRYDEVDSDHAAYWGKTSGALLNPAQTTFLSWANNIPNDNVPDIVVINLGTNDANSGITTTTFTNNITTIIGLMRAANPNVTIILSNLVGTTVAWDSAIVEYNTAIANFIANPTNSTETSSIVLADIRTGFDKTNWLYDNLHPNELGENFIAGVYYKAITTVLAGVPEPETFAPFAGIAAFAVVFFLRRRREQQSQRLTARKISIG